MAHSDIARVLDAYQQTRDHIQQNPNALTQIVDQFIANAHRHKELNAFIRLYEAEARAEAQQQSKELEAGKGGQLAGMVVGLKDLICYKDHPVEGISKILEGFVSLIDATAVARIRRAGAIILGHQNGDELGMGSASTHTIHGRVKHPIDPARVAGGSSGGSAVAVQAKMCHVSLGTDTGGSVRQPAALCGVVGFRPSYSLISRYGLLAYASSFDTIGILAHNVSDTARVLGVIAGADPADHTTSAAPVPDYIAHLNHQPKRSIAYLTDGINHPALQPEIKARCFHLFNALQKEQHTVKPIDFPLLPYILPTYFLLTTSEASANLARYDGVRYGYRAEGAKNFKDMIRQTRKEGFGTEVKKRILLGTCILGSDYQAAYYDRAQRVRQKIKQALEDILATHDFILLPTTPTTAFYPDADASDPVTTYLADLYTVLAPIAGLPAISIPYGHDAHGLPIGMQIIGRPFQEKELLAFAQSITPPTT